MRCRGCRRTALIATLLALAACTPRPAPPQPDPALLATHEWAHGPPWGPQEPPWIPLADWPVYGPGYGYGPAGWAYDPWGPGGWWGPSFGIGLGFSRGPWWRGHRAPPGWAHHGWHGGFRGGGHRRH